MKKSASVMLRRGLDVKVAELPLGKDPADLILENPTEFKRVVAESVHVIEFLLHVLRREVEDDRSFKLKAREEILPFILLLPNRIDQEHFVGKVAESIETTTDAIRFELDRLREQAVATAAKESEVRANTETLVRPRVKVSSDTAQKTFVYLSAAVQVVDSELAKIIEKEILEISQLTKLTELTDADLAGAVFSIEQQFTNLPRHAVLEELAAKLNQFKTYALRKQLAELRQALQTIEESGDDSKLEETLGQIRDNEIKLREPAYIADELLVIKD
jgi:DNA primase